MTGKTFDGSLDLRVRGRSWKKNATPPLYVNVLPNDEELWAISTDQSGGLRGGDRQSTSIDVTEGGRLKYSPACAALYHAASSKSDRCVVKQSLFVDANSRLIYRPKASIPCRGAHVDQTTTIRIEGDAQLFYWDVWTCGRVASGERWKFESLTNRLELYRDDRIVYQERWSTSSKSLRAPYDPAGFQDSAMWFLAIAAGDFAHRLLELDVAFWKSQGGRGEVGVLEPGIWIARALAPQAWQIHPLS